MTEPARVFSPFQPDLEAKLTRTIDSKRIIELYKEVGVDVGRFFEGVENVGIYECRLTKYRFYHPLSLAGDDQFYEELQHASDDYYPEGKLEFEIALGKLSKGERVLEVGCGAGLFLERLREREIEGIGLEFNDLALEKCRKKGLDVRNGSVADFAKANASQFDAVVSFQVLEHIPAVAEFIRDLLTCLKPGGKLIFGVPDNSPYHKNFRIYLTFNLPPHHIGLWNAESFANLEKVFPVELESVEYDNDYSSFPNYVYHCGDLFLSRFPRLYNSRLVRHLLIVGLLPFTIPFVLKMKVLGELRPHTIIATFTRS